MCPALSELRLPRLASERGEREHLELELFVHAPGDAVSVVTLAG